MTKEHKTYREDDLLEVLGLILSETFLGRMIIEKIFDELDLIEYERSQGMRDDIQNS